jgi:hypothetical protein
LAERVGQYLKGRYRVDHVLHIGARSTVYAGADQKSGRVAIKVLNCKADASVLQGSYLANAVGHPSAVSVLDTGSTDDGAIFLVMELLEATSMRDLLGQHEGHLPVRLACTLADQGLDLLASAHAQGIAHGELHLDKLFYTRTERLKVLGFGKPANEQAVTEDVRALSKAIAWLLCGEPVESLQASPAASAVQTRLPARIASVFERGLAADAQQWKSAHAMRTALQLACKAELGRPIDRGLQPLAAATKPVKRPARTVWLAGAAALIVGLYVSREVAELGDEQAPEAEAETDIAAALQPPQANAQAEEEKEPEQPAPTTTTADEDEDEDKATVEAANEAKPSAVVVPRKAHRPHLRLPIQRQGTIQTNIAPLSQLCAQLSSARQAGPLSDHEAQLYKARCTKR